MGLIGPYETEEEALAICGESSSDDPSSSSSDSSSSSSEDCSGWYCCIETNTVVYIDTCEEYDTYECGSSGGGISTDCCSNLPSTLVVTVGEGCCPCLAGSYVVSVESATGGSATWGVGCAADICGDTSACVAVQCSDSSWTVQITTSSCTLLGIGCSGGCDPFSLTCESFITGTCCSGQGSCTITVAPGNGLDGPYETEEEALAACEGSSSSSSGSSSGSSSSGSLSGSSSGPSEPSSGSSSSSGSGSSSSGSSSSSSSGSSGSSSSGGSCTLASACCENNLPCTLYVTIDGGAPAAINYNTEYGWWFGLAGQLYCSGEGQVAFSDGINPTCFTSDFSCDPPYFYFADCNGQTVIITS